MATSAGAQVARIGRDFAAFRAKWPRVQMRALNRTISTGRTLLSRAIAADMGLPINVVRDQIKISQATPDRLTARLEVSGKRIPLIDFRATGPRPSRGRGRGVTARFPGGAGRYPHAFIVTMPSGHVGVFERTGKKQLPIYELFGPSIPKVFTKHSPETLRALEAEQAKNLAHEIAFASGVRS